MATLLERIKEHYKESSYPPMEEDLGDDVVQVSWKVIDDSPRWGSVVMIVFREGEDHVAVRDVEPATENQGWGDYGDPEIFEVEPKEVVTIKYVKKES